MKLQTIDIKDGVKLNIWKTEQFKTVSLFFDFGQVFDKNQATCFALLTDVLGNACAKYPSEDALTNQKEKLFGLGYSSSCETYGNTFHFIFQANIIDDTYLNDNNKTLIQSLEFIKEIIFNPLLDKDGFEKKYYRTWQDRHYQRLQSRMNNKEVYAARKLKELYDQNHPVSAFLTGQMDHIHKTTSKEVYAAYQSLFSNQVDIYAIGNVNEPILIDWIKANFTDFKKSAIPVTCPYPKHDYLEKIEEKKNFTQSYLNLVYTIDKLELNEAPIFFVFNTLFGNGAGSKLFKVVREKYGLCYSISSSIALHYGMAFVSCGIDAKNYTKTKDLIVQELDKVIKGDFTNEELINAKATLVTMYEQGFDTPGGVYYLYSNSFRKQQIFDKDLAIEEINKVSKEDLMMVAKRLSLTISYLVKQGERKA